MKIQVVVADNTFYENAKDKSLRFQATFIGDGSVYSEFGATKEEVLRKVKDYFETDGVFKHEVVDLEVGE